MASTPSAISMRYPGCWPTLKPITELAFPLVLFLPPSFFLAQLNHFPNLFIASVFSANWVQTFGSKISFKSPCISQREDSLQGRFLRLSGWDFSVREWFADCKRRQWGWLTATVGCLLNVTKFHVCHLHFTLFYRKKFMFLVDVFGWLVFKRI